MSAEGADAWEPRSLQTYDLDGVRRRWLLVLGVAVLTALAVLGATRLTGGSAYTSSTTVLVNPLQGSPFGTDARGANLENLQTEAELARSDLVAERARASLGAAAAVSELLDRLAVENPPNSQVLRISFTDAAAQAAQNGASAFAQAYLDLREERALQQGQSRVDALEASVLENERARAEAVEAAARADAGSAEQQLAQQRLETVTSALSGLESQISELRLQDTDPGTILSPASLPEAPSGLPVPVLAIAGLGLGLGLGLALAAWRAYRDQRVHRAEEVEQLGYPVLALVPQTPAEITYEELLASNGKVRDEVHVLQTILASTLSAKERCLVLAPVDDDLVIGPLVAELAMSLARSERPVVVLDADLRDRPMNAGASATDMSRDTQAPGLSEVLHDGMPVSRAGRNPLSNLLWVPPGVRRQHTVDQLASPRMEALVTDLSGRTDWLIVACGRAGLPATTTVAAISRRVVLVVRLGQTTVPALRAAAEGVERCGARLIGVVVETRDTRPRIRIFPVPASAVSDAAPIDPRRSERPLSTGQPVAVEQ